MRIRSIAVAGPLLLAGALAASTPGLSQASGGQQPEQAAPEVQRINKLAATKPCVGGKQKRAFSGGHSDWFWTSSADTVPGTVWHFKGPKRRKDTVFVTVSAPNTYAGTGDHGTVRVLLDGNEMRPANGFPENFYDENNYGSFAGQYCARVGKGSHQVRLELTSTDANGNGSDTAYLYNAVLHVEVAE